MRSKGILLAVALLLVLAASSQVPRLIHAMPTVTFKALMAHIDVFANVKVSEVAQGRGLVTRIRVNNYTDKTVRSIEYGWRIAAPAACTNAMTPHWETATVDVVIPPHGEVRLTPVESLSSFSAKQEVAARAEATHTPVVLVTVGILKATFTDGSTWLDDNAAESQMFDGGAWEKRERCQLRMSGK
jgi:hypothetical protein